MRHTQVSPGRLFLLPVIVLLSTIATQTSPVHAAALEQHWWVCTYQDLKDPAKPAQGSFMYYAVFASSDDDMSHGLTNHFNGYVQQNYKVTDNHNSGSGYCRRVSDAAAGRTYSMDLMQKQWTSSNIEPILVKWTDTPAEDSIIDAKLAGKASPPPAPSTAAGSKECQFHGTCPKPAPTGLKPPGH